MQNKKTKKKLSWWEVWCLNQRVYFQQSVIILLDDAILNVSYEQIILTYLKNMPHSAEPGRIQTKKKKNSLLIYEKLIKKP